jgi:hypothetical protein
MAGRRQIAKPSRRQLGFAIGRNVLDQLSNLAKGISDLVEKGIAADPRTGQPITLRCTPADIKASWTPEQLGAVEEFVSNFLLDPEPSAPPPAPQNPPGKKNRK